MVDNLVSLCHEEKRDFNFANKVFDHVDMDNTKRLVEWMINRKKKENDILFEHSEEYLLYRNSNIRSKSNKPTVSNQKRKGNPVYKFIKFAYG